MEEGEGGGVESVEWGVPILVGVVILEQMSASCSDSSLFVVETRSCGYTYLGCLDIEKSNFFYSIARFTGPASRYLKEAVHTVA